jgi:WD40 repeat protein
VAFAPGDRWLASVGRDGRVLLWDLAGGPPVVLGRHEDFGRAVEFHPSEMMLASADDDGMIYFWDLAGMDGSAPGENAPAAFDSVSTNRREIFDIAISPDGRLLASGSWDGTIRLWDTATREQVGESIATQMTEIRDVAFSPDGALLAVAGKGSDVALIDVAAREVADQLLTNQTTRINAVAFSPDGRLLATGSADSSIGLWDVATRRPVGLPLAIHSGEVHAVAFSPDGRLLASADENGRIFLARLAYEDLAATVCAIVDRDLTPVESEQYLGRAPLAGGCSTDEEEGAGIP